MIWNYLTSKTNAYRRLPRGSTGFAHSNSMATKLRECPHQTGSPSSPSHATDGGIPGGSVIGRLKTRPVASGVSPLDDNNLVGHIPPEIGNLTSLSQLYLGVPEWRTAPGTGPTCILHPFMTISTVPSPPEIGKLTRLQAFRITNGTFAAGTHRTDRPGDPVETGLIGNRTIHKNASIVAFQESAHSAATPRTVTEEPATLSLWKNSLSGPFPIVLTTLTGLRTLSLPDNQLTGTIPPSLANLKGLYHLSLHDNQLTGSIPSELAKLSGLAYVDLNNNRLSGPIPPELGNLPNLRRLKLADNELTGPIPTEFGNLINLEQLVLSGNRLSGPIPAELGFLLDLYRISLEDNELTGSIPPEVGELPSLWQLNLDRNQLEGCVPRSLMGMRELTLYPQRGAQIRVAFCAEDP